MLAGDGRVRCVGQVHEVQRHGAAVDEVCTAGGVVAGAQAYGFCLVGDLPDRVLQQGDVHRPLDVNGLRYEVPRCGPCVGVLRHGCQLLRAEG